MTRRIRQLHVTAPDASAATRARWLIEDALNTAALDDAGRLLLIRRLHLPRLDLRSSSAAIATRLEAQVRELKMSAVHALSPSAPAAPAVYFRSTLEPQIALLEKLIHGELPYAWFWPRAVPIWRPSMDRVTAIRRLIAGLWQQPAGVVAVADLVSRLIEAAQEAPLMQALDEPFIASLSRAFAEPPALLELASVELPQIAFRHQQRLVFWLQKWSRDASRSRWLSAMLCVAQRPQRASDTRLPVMAIALLRTVAELELPPSIPGRLATSDASAQPSPQPNLVSNAAVDDGARERIPREPEAQAAAPIDARRSASAAVESHPKIAEVFAQETEGESLARGRLPRSQINRSDYAGLLFLLPVLQRLGIGEWMDAWPEHREAQWAERGLLSICDSLRVPQNDALRSLLAVEHEPPFAAWALPAQWLPLLQLNNGLHAQPFADDSGTDWLLLHEPHRRLPLAVLPTAEAFAWAAQQGLALRIDQQAAALSQAEAALAPARAWHGLLRRWLRRRASMSLYTLAHRSARIDLTRTHLDVSFALASADLRVRKTGLDLDPGWLPWLGRIVAFHYREGSLDEPV